MTRNKHLILIYLAALLVFMLFAGSVAQAASQLAAGHPRLIELFISSDMPITGMAVISSAPGRPTPYLQTYNLDSIQRIETQLSEGLTADPKQSKQVVLHRFQQLNEDDRARMQQAAIGLAKAVQYGVDRYPAMVFDGGAVIYGVTDIHEALLRYQQWREGRQP
ncbi:TIGR03757 family integrating conjugative element protein [Sedimenticola selenatireducens]|uniref:TIGR03757 family integrating conjugative element protein n=1 Tax=Sedimenticola selenatireducens TaxID=191960 RepID=UPI0012F79F7E|nr:TIGR03757 family integrating conjugative element protein [Sedimenticola selenatireducens]